MNPHDPIPEPGDDRMRALFHDAVADVAPRDGLAEVRRRTRARRTSSARRWAPVLVGAGAVAATVVAATFLVSGWGDDDRNPDDRPPVAGTSTAIPITSAAGIYYVADTDSGPRLFREFQAIGTTTDPAERVLLALERLTADVGPRDPDYRTLWPADSFAAVRVEDDRVIVELGTDAALQGSDGAGVGRYGVQQAVYTAEAALGDALPVSFEWNGEPARQVLGLRVGAVVERDRSYDVTAPVNITDPAEDLAVEDGTLRANGTMATYVTDVDWALLQGGQVVRDGRALAVDITGPDARATLGAPGWEIDEVDISDLAPGDYVFVVSVTDVGQTSDQTADFSDTRTITVR
ncbi:GerMN domain-containing protein [Nocardioides pelophilus]|uniref:GerMN domain-containing protein n=1 Tax=Nocardioides pelophilus TaxID=2172019 RepID=UPI001601A8A9|nr:GerMN domain-containing protein [Nocardioides pelophilus]